MIRICWALFFLLSIALLGGCGGNGTDGGGGTTGVQIVLNTPTVSVAPGGVHTFVAAVTGATDTSVEWTVLGGPANGTITSGGVYTAPSAPGVYRVTVYSVADPGAQASAEVTVDTGINITISPQGPTVKVGSNLQFSATVTGTGNSSVRYFVPGIGTAGTIDATGLYTAPLTPGSYEVQAICRADESRISKTLVNVVPGVDMRLTSPTTLLRALYGSWIQLRANVTGTSNTTVNWSIEEGAVAGTIDANGKFVAGTTEGYYHIVGTSAADPTVSVRYTVLVAPSARVRVQTNKGTFILKLRPDQAPRHCANLVSLANDKFYDGIIFHRYEVGFVIQGGDPLTKTLPLDDPQIGSGGSGTNINFEANPLLHKKYALGMARGSSLNSASSQWYVTLTAQPSLDGQYVVFGEVDDNTAVIDQLRRGDVMQSVTVIP